MRWIVLVAVALLLSPAAPITTIARPSMATAEIFFEDFEQGFGDWEASGDWNLTDRSDAPGQAAHLAPEGDSIGSGQEHDACQPCRGTLVSPWVDLPEDEVHLYLEMSNQIPNRYDTHTTLLVETAHGLQEHEVLTPVGSSALRPVHIPLDAISGQEVRLHFDVHANLIPWTGGLAIDDVLVTTETLDLLVTQEVTGAGPGATATFTAAPDQEVRMALTYEYTLTERAVAGLTGERDGERFLTATTQWSAIHIPPWDLTVWVADQQVVDRGNQQGDDRYSGSFHWVTDDPRREVTYDWDFFFDGHEDIQITVTMTTSTGLQSAGAAIGGNTKTQVSARDLPALLSVSASNDQGVLVVDGRLDVQTHGRSMLLFNLHADSATGRFITPSGTVSLHERIFGVMEATGEWSLQIDRMRGSSRIFLTLVELPERPPQEPMPPPEDLV